MTDFVENLPLVVSFHRIRSTPPCISGILSIGLKFSDALPVGQFHWPSVFTSLSSVCSSSPVILGPVGCRARSGPSACHGSNHMKKVSPFPTRYSSPWANNPLNFNNLCQL
ncbi:hypothetical protein Salat_0925700 [Sesamum alatum]|uniref:Uncharacterized protein n=1 Tax=Sesamum alatum TaxID=300844 RepID=A0AAE1YJZ9_9LAMI|nr:hypothetical protein Salat_0925700 [Sesamum alatum]